MAEAPRGGIALAGALNLVGGVTGALIALVLAAVVGRELGTEGAGVYFLAIAASMILANVAELGADTGLVRFVSAARATDRLTEVPGLVRTAVRTVAAVGTVVVVAVVVWVVLAGQEPGGLPAALVVAMATAAILSALTALLLAVTRGLGDVLSYPLLQNVALPVLRLLGVLVVVAAGGGTVAVLAAWVAPVPVVLAICAVVAVSMVRRSSQDGRRSGTTVPRSPATATREFWSFSSARGLSAAAEIGLEWADVILVGALASAEEAGIYAVVTRCARAGEVIQQAARIAVGPQLGAALARGATVEAGHLYGLATAAMTWLAWPMFVVLAVFSDTVLSLFGPGFERGASSLVVLSLAMALSTAAGTVQTILLMGGRSRWQLMDKSAALVLNLCLNLLLVPWLGILGAAVAWAVTICADTALVVYQVQRLMQVRPRYAPLVTAAATALGVVGTTTGLARWWFGSSLPVMLGATAAAAVAYLLVSAALRHRLGLVELVQHRSS